MQLQPGARLGPYVVVQQLGSGGMGDVYQARDTRLDRLVAIKVIAGAREEGDEVRARFASEARAIASLNHPHICALYDTGFEAGQPYLVMEYLEGETLTDRLRRGVPGLREVLGIAIEIADALAHAHRHGILHRDLKPANVFLTRGSGAKLLDFGIAVMQGAAAGDLSKLATEPVNVTADGVIVGTLHYIAPERLDGQRADERSDIYALGALTYEMLAGRRPFEEPTQARLISAILTREPEPLNAAPGVRAELSAFVTTLLSKDPEDRWQSMRDVAKMLRAIASGLGTASSPLHGAGGLRRHWLLLTAAVGLAAAALGAAVASSARRPPSLPARVVRFLVPPPAGGSLGLTSSTVQSAQLAVAPSGTMLTFVAAGPRGREQLFVRRFDEVEPHALVGTEDATYPFWSPDSRQIGFFAEGRLKIVRVAGGPPQSICPAANARGGTWSTRGEIVFVPDINRPLYRVSVVERTATPLGTLPAGHTGHRWPQFLPGEDRVLLLAQSTDPAAGGIYVMSLADPAHPRRLREALTNGLYSAGHLLYVQEGSLIAERFDLDALRLSGERVPLGLPVTGSSSFYSAFSASDNGVLAAWAEGEAASELVWFNRKGERLGTLAQPARYVDFRLSPDGNRLAVAVVDPRAGTSDLWLVDINRETSSRLTFARQTDATPVWAATGDRIVFRSNRGGGRHELFLRPAHAAAQDQLLFSGTAGLYPTDWSADAATIVYHAGHQGTDLDISRLDVAAKKSTNLTPEPFDQAQGQLAVGNRLAYMSTEVGDPSVFVRRLDGSEGSQRVSPAGGFDPRWRADGRELFYLDPEGHVVAAQMAPSSLHVTGITPLFSIRLPGPTPPYLSNYVATADGQRFLVRVPLELPQSRPITVVLDWPRLASR
jgi:Tol biopolymer transport system component